MEVLCRILKQVARQAPVSATIYCIINNLGQFEKNHCAESHLYLLYMLNHLIEYEGPSPRVKVLVTSSRRSWWLREVVQEKLRELTERG